MKNIFFSLSIVLCLLAQKLNAQTNNSSKAEKHFSNFEYTNAVKVYLKLIDEQKADEAVYKKLADIFYLMDNSEEALKWYKQAIAIPQDAETHFNYAQTLRKQGNIADFKNQMELFVVKSPNDPRAIAYKKKPNYLPELEKIKSNILVTPLLENTNFSDFGAIFFQDKVYFATNRFGRKHNRINKMTGEPFTKIYQADYVKGSLENTREVHDLNSRSNDGIVCFNKQFNRAYFSSSTININENLQSKDKFKSKNFSKQQIFVAQKSDVGYWTNYTSLPFCNPEFSYLNPVLSPDENFLFFASDMSGGFGGFDIWKVQINADGSFGQPENLGAMVNTNFDENFPFIKEDDGLLFFASQGHEGFGGFDIFEINLNNKNAKAANIGIPFNTEKDEFAFSYYESDSFGFLTSNRSGNTDIFKVEKPREEILRINLLNPETNLPIANVDVQVLDSNGKLIKTLKTNNEGQIVDNIPNRKKYTLKVIDDAFEPFETNVNNSFKGIENLSLKLVQKPISEEIKQAETYEAYASMLKSNPVLFDFNKYELSKESLTHLDKIILMMHSNTDIKILVKGHTDSRGSANYNLKLSEKRAKAAFDYLVSNAIDKSRISIKPMGETSPLVDCKNNCSDEDHAKNRRTELVVTLPNDEIISTE